MAGSIPSGYLVLQWGHDLTVMESAPDTPVLIAEGELQWGHDLTVMESRARCPPVAQPAVASMGP